MGDSIGKHEVYKLRSKHRAHRLKRKVVGRVQKKKSVFVKKKGRQTRQSSKDKNLNEDKSIFNFFSPQLRAKSGRASFPPPVLLHSAASGQRFVGMGFFSLLSLTKIRPLKINQTNQNSSPGQSLKYDIIRTKL